MSAFVLVLARFNAAKGVLRVLVSLTLPSLVRPERLFIVIVIIPVNPAGYANKNAQSRHEELMMLVAHDGYQYEEDTEDK